MANRSVTNNPGNRGSQPGGPDTGDTGTQSPTPAAPPAPSQVEKEGRVGLGNPSGMAKDTDKGQDKEQE